MKNFWDEISGKIDALSRRERVICAGMALALVYAVGQYLILDPQVNANKLVAADIMAANQELENLRTETKMLTYALQVGPNQAERLKIANLEKAVSELNETLAASTARLLPPAQMAKVLEEVLTAEQDIKVISLENLPVETLVSADDTAVEGGGAIAGALDIGLYKHGFVMTIEGPYRKVYEFLAKLEGRPWHFFWQRMQFTVVQYPQSQAKIEVYTLSTREGWVGVE